MYEGLVLVTTNISSVFVQISKRKKENKAILLWLSANRFIPNAAVIQDKCMIGRICIMDKIVAHYKMCSLRKKIIKKLCPW